MKKKLIKLDLACGQTKEKGWIGIDIAKTKGVDIVHDLEVYPWPIEDESVSEIKCIMYIEHVKDLMKFMNEVHRVLVKGGTASFVAPYYSSMRAMQDPTHVRPISEATFLYYNKQWRDANKLDHYPITADFDFTYGYSIDPSWVSRSQEARDYAIRHYINVVSDIQVVVTKR